MEKAFGRLADVSLTQLKYSPTPRGLLNLTTMFTKALQNCNYGFCIHYPSKQICMKNPDFIHFCLVSYYETDNLVISTKGEIARNPVNMTGNFIIEINQLYKK